MSIFGDGFLWTNLPNSAIMEIRNRKETDVMNETFGYAGMSGEVNVDLDALITCALIELGVATNLSGYSCLHHAFHLRREDPGSTLTKELYPEVGKRCTPALSGAHVEKAIRYAIDTAWERRDAEIWHRYFPQDRKPTNGEFIARILQLAELWQKYGNGPKI